MESDRGHTVVRPVIVRCIRTEITILSKNKFFYPYSKEYLSKDNLQLNYNSSGIVSIVTTVSVQEEA